jgi:hypothetical protein
MQYDVGNTDINRVFGFSNRIGPAIVQNQGQDKKLWTINLVSFAVASGILWWQNITLARENAQLRQARNQAAELLKAWPKPENLDFVSTAQCRGVVLSGLAFLEAHQENFPKTFEALNRLFIDAFGVTSKEREKWWEESANVHEAAAVMIQLIKALQI